MVEPYYNLKEFSLFHGDCNIILPQIDRMADLVFADPPYFLSNGGQTVENGKIVSVDKGNWDKLDNETIYQFNYKWISAIRGRMKKSATLWISGNMNNIYTIYQVLKDLDFKILNTIIWEKTNPPPNFTCKFFTHSNEIIIWARITKTNTHFYNYSLMKEINQGKQMKDVWRLPAIAPWEKINGKHPTQKPLSVLSRIILSSTEKDALVLDPFTGSSTTGIAANLLGREYIGIDIESEYLDLGIKRKNQLDLEPKLKVISKINGLKHLDKSTLARLCAF